MWKLIPLLALVACGTTTDVTRQGNRVLKVDERRVGVENGQQVDVVVQRTEQEDNRSSDSTIMTVQPPSIAPLVRNGLNAGGIPWGEIAQAATVAIGGGALMYVRKLNQHEERKVKERGKSA